MSGECEHGYGNGRCTVCEMEFLRSQLSAKDDELKVAYEYVEQAKERCDIKDAEIERLRSALDLSATADFPAEYWIEKADKQK